MLYKLRRGKRRAKKEEVWRSRLSELILRLEERARIRLTGEAW
jgi:hypothetical protein